MVTLPMNTSRLFRAAHRRLGLVFALLVFAAAGSGALHTLMSMGQPPPPPPPPNRLGACVAQAALGPAKALSEALASGETASAITLVEIDGRPWYRIRVAKNAAPRYVAADTGERDDAADDRYAARIASAYLRGAPVRKTATLTSYDGEYIAIFRSLPVIRFDAGDAAHTRLYVSTDTGSVARATDDAKQFEANVFGLVHKYMFIHDKGPRDIAMLVVMGGIALVSLTGVLLFFLTRPRRKPAIRS